MVGIIEYGTGNLKSVENALKRLGAGYIVTSDEKVLENCSRIILPGVGSAGFAMENLRKSGLDSAIKRFTQPVLGICLGMQLLCSYSEEESTECLGIFSNRVERFKVENLKIPHVGWNSLCNLKSGLYHQVPENSFVYFVHSYCANVNENTVAVANYGYDFSASLKCNNFYSCQFHPEKSGDIGEKILDNFLKNTIINV